jgi:hypothetical protein
MKRTFLMVVGVLAALPAVAAVTGMGGPDGPSDALWHATVQVESKGNPHAYNPRDGASGIAQIRSVCLADVNRIARERGLGERYAAADLTDPAKARRLWALYLDYYGDVYEKQTGRAPTDEIYARIWNGGPTGWRKAATREYWERIRSAME